MKRAESTPSESENDDDDDDDDYDEEEEPEDTGPELRMFKTGQKFSANDRSIYFHPDRNHLKLDIPELIKNKQYTELVKMKTLVDEMDRIPNLKGALGNFGESNIDYDQFLEDFNLKEVTQRRMKYMEEQEKIRKAEEEKRIAEEEANKKKRRRGGKKPAAGAV